VTCPGQRWLRFNLVGLAGFGVQLAALWSLTAGLRIHYLPATLLAVEVSILHNFFWHERWTWSDRQLHRSGMFSRLLRFHLANGAVSLVGNLLLMATLVGGLGCPVLPANLLAVLLCSLVNFAASDRLVFQHGASREQRMPC
jgi:dolichol-phosphate mannosyltransferase